MNNLTYPPPRLYASVGSFGIADFALEHPAPGLARPMPLMAGFVLPAAVLPPQVTTDDREDERRKGSYVEVSVNMCGSGAGGLASGLQPNQEEIWKTLIFSSRYQILF